MPDAATASQVPQQVVALAPVLHAAIALWGLIECFLGFRIFKATVRILMAFAGAAIGASAAVSYQPESLGALALGAGLGLIVGLLLGWFLYRLGVFTLGVFLGTVLSAPLTGMVGPEYAWMIGAAGGLVGGVLALFLVNTMVMAATALTGSFRLVYGVAFFFGGPSLLILIENPERYGQLATDQPLYSLLTLLIGAIGCYFQYSSNQSKKKDD